MVRSAYKGVVASVGAAYGKIVVIAKVADEQDTAGTSKRALNVQIERSRYFHAVEEADKALDMLLKTSEDLGKDILEAEKLLLNDTDFHNRIVRLIENEKLPAEDAVKRSSEHYIKLFDNSEDEEIRARGESIVTVKELILNSLCTGNKAIINLSEPAILVSDNITAATLLEMNRSYIKGIALTKGSSLSHAAILSRAMNIPMLILCDINTPSLLDGHCALIDADSASLIVNPSEEEINNISRRNEENTSSSLQCYSNFELVRHTLSETTKMKIYANAGSLKDVKRAVLCDIEGIGLFRSEFLFFNKDKAPSEEEQFLLYEEVLRAAAGKTVTIRTADFGDDKIPSYISMYENERGIEFSLRENNLFETQIRALLRASAYGNLSIMFPMIKTEEEFIKAKAMVEKTMASLREYNIPFDKNIRLGVMIETLEAINILNKLSKQADFFSIGTNDLIYSVLNRSNFSAAYKCVDSKSALYKDPNQENLLKTFLDRTEASVEFLKRETSINESFDDEKKRFLMDTIKNITSVAHGAGISAAVCGELANSSEWIPFFESLGLDALSINI